MEEHRELFEHMDYILRLSAIQSSMTYQIHFFFSLKKKKKKKTKGKEKENKTNRTHLYIRSYSTELVHGRIQVSTSVYPIILKNKFLQDTEVEIHVKNRPVWFINMQLRC